MRDGHVFGQRRFCVAHITAVRAGKRLRVLNGHRIPTIEQF